MILDIEHGGLKAIDVKIMQQALLIKWVKMFTDKSEETWKNIPGYYFNKLGKNNSVFQSDTALKSFKSIDLIGKNFYCDVLKTWLVTQKRDPLDPASHVL